MKLNFVGVLIQKWHQKFNFLSDLNQISTEIVILLNYHLLTSYNSFKKTMFYKAANKSEWNIQFEVFQTPEKVA